MAVLEWLFDTKWRAPGVLDGLAALGLFAVSRVGVEPRRQKHRRTR
ncbi:hypothetical protein [Streptomyces sp. NPDC059080]